WTPVLSNIARSSSIKPELESWKDTLDTLLIFIALFSAIVTSFLVPALAGLSQDPAERTNELVSNLTEVIIQLSQGQTSSLDFPESIPFNPNPGVIRQVVFWTLSLLTSVSCVFSLINNNIFHFSPQISRSPSHP
ncbi:uncharacterized protein STEHIDRAFT_64732, partial [Stereum hirsutum FP-91666 SS1]|uniref:uncharacterized protein n=1 Tax=Stereum hirsutum (strain FP-91666) TaxID=721885 RepID=UPI00044496FA